MFADRELLPINLTTETYQYAALAVGLSILAMLLPAISAARFSIVTYKQDVARTSRRAVLQRFFFDFIVAGAAGYGYYLLREQRSLVTLGEEGGVFSNPLLLVVPALFVFAASLLFLRILPVFIEILARVGAACGAFRSCSACADWPDAGAVYAAGNAAHPDALPRHL